jgi:adenine-specific DNA-methyltransferase
MPHPVVADGRRQREYGVSKYGHLDKAELLRLLERRDAERQLGLVWERDEIEADRAINDDYVALELDAALSHGEAPWDNLIIEGDNFDALRALRVSHKGAIRCIYIDPPYNTGNRDFVYNDRFVDKTHRFRHSLWLEFMYRRLLLARELLADDGVIFVSIDDNELFRLGMLMDRVFGEGGHVATCVWQKRYSRENRGAIGDAHEYLLAYARDSEKFKQARNLVPMTEVQAKIYKNKNSDPNGRWRSIPMTAQGYRPNQMYEIEGPHGEIHTPPEGRCWSLVENEYLKLKEQGRIYFGSDGRSQPSVIRYLSEVGGVVPWTWWPHEEVGHTDEARKEIQSIFGTQTAFDTPKPVRLIERILRIATKPNDTVLDFFAGSGTLGQAVAKLNAEDGGTRKFILVSSTEATEDAPDKNLCRDVCAERVRRVLGGYTNGKGEAVPGLAGNFAYLRARRLPKHRLAQKLAHAEVWCALQLLHARALTAWTGHGFAADTSLAYLADFHATHVQRLHDWLATRAEQESTLYSWSPARVAELVDERRGLRCLPIPQHLRDRFGR